MRSEHLTSGHSWPPPSARHYCLRAAPLPSIPWRPCGPNDLNYLTMRKSRSIGLGVGVCDIIVAELPIRRNSQESERRGTRGLVLGFVSGHGFSRAVGLLGKLGFSRCGARKIHRLAARLKAVP